MKASTIWIEGETKPDTYVEFIGNFSVENEGKISINIACDSCFAVYINGKLACFGEAADYPWYRMYHRVDVTAFCCETNEVKILVWYYGTDSQRYIKGEPSLWFEIKQEQKLLLVSGSHILSRKNLNYKNNYCKKITYQLGYSYYYDNTVKNVLPYLPSVETGIERQLHLRKTGYLTLGERSSITWCKTKEGYLVDLGEEIVGFLEVSFNSTSEQEILIAYGEHLVDGQVPRIIGERDFSVELKARKGENTYLSPFRRLAGRYLQVFCKDDLEITYIGIRPTDTQVVEKQKEFDDSLLQKIYDVSVNTLKKCMHEHYEDCPWREQAMYALDSRNQMLCGYYAFEGYEYQRENLLFIAKGQREDGLLSLCFPAGVDIPIPFFSLVYIMQVHDYVFHTKDRSVLQDVKPVIDKILDVFNERIDENGLIPNFPYPYWNFYEWAEASNHENEIERTADEAYEKQYDLILNCMYIYVSKLYERLFDTNRIPKEMFTIINDVFYNQEKKLYKLSTKEEHYSQLGNSLVMLMGLGDETLADRMIRDETIIPVTLSMNTFFYDALLQYGDKYKEYILNDIRRKYGSMLEQGATTFWETEKGWRDFNGAGSLCHGWSSIPVYYLSVLL